MTDILSPPAPATPAADEAQNDAQNQNDSTGTQATSPAAPEAPTATEPTTSESTSPVNDDLAKALSGVSGLGPAKQEQLAQTFGTLDKLKNASVEDLTNIKGVGVGVAERILATVNGKPVETTKPTRKATTRKATTKKSTAKAATSKSTPAASAAPTKATAVSVSGNVLTIETPRGTKQFELDRPSLILDLNQDVRAAAQEFVSTLSL